MLDKELDLMTVGYPKGGSKISTLHIARFNFRERLRFLFSGIIVVFVQTKTEYVCGNATSDINCRVGESKDFGTLKQIKKQIEGGKL